jgi:putative ABC transport system substrate-binding protein
MKRRAFIALLGSAALAAPNLARAQDSRVRRIGFLSGIPENDPEGRARLFAFLAELQRLGWVDGRNVHIDYRIGAREASSIQKHVDELIALAPEVILVNGTEAAEPLRQTTRSIRSSSCRYPIRLALVSSQVWPGPAETSRDLPTSNTA